MTPIQQAIEYVESEMAKWRRDDSIDAPIYTAYELTRNHLQSLLPKEKEFAKKCFDGAVKIAEDNVHWDKDEQCKETDHSMIEKEKTYFLNQLYPKP